MHFFKQILYFRIPKARAWTISKNKIANAVVVLEIEKLNICLYIYRKIFSFEKFFKSFKFH